MTPGVSSCQYTENPRSISFSGSGFLATYQLGVAQCFLHYAPWIVHCAPSILGSSAGSLVAAAVVCEMNLSKWLSYVLQWLLLDVFITHLFPNPLIYSYHSGWDDSFCQGSEVFHPWTTEPLDQVFSLAGMYFKQASPVECAPTGQRSPCCYHDPSDGWRANSHVWFWLQRRCSTGTLALLF